jgi:hypothetical protein
MQSNMYDFNVQFVEYRRNSAFARQVDTRTKLAGSKEKFGSSIIREEPEASVDTFLCVVTRTKGVIFRFRKCRQQVLRIVYEALSDFRQKVLGCLIEWT